MKVVIAGSGGFIGKYLVDRFCQMGKEVIEVRRRGSAVTYNRSQLIAALEGAELLINLAGKSVNCRYTKANKRAIYNSRLSTTHHLGMAILQCKNPPQLWINASTATIYRDAKDRPMTELEGDIGTGFSVDVATRWESGFFRFDLPRTRQIALRMALVLGTTGGVLPAYKNLVRFGLGGKQGSGDQRMSFVHIQDLFEAIIFLKQRTNLSGVFNVSSPEVVTNREFMRALRRRMTPIVSLPQPRWMLEVGAFLVRTETELLLKSRWVASERLLNAGFHFRFDTLHRAMDDLV